MALKWTAKTDEQRKIMIASNNIKLDFLKTFFNTFFYDAFSLIEYVVSQDVLKISEDKVLNLWNMMEKKYPNELLEIRFQLTKFLYPKQLNKRTYNELTKEQKKLFEELDASNALKYAIWHLFALGDLNFEWNYVHNPKGYVSIGGDREIFFNKIRKLAYQTFKDSWDYIFDRKIIAYDNYKIVLKEKYSVPPPYNWVFWKKDYKEVTYENWKWLDYYDNQEKLKWQMNYMYENLITRWQYEKFWNNYRSRYFELKSRYKEAYNIDINW